MCIRDREMFPRYWDFYAGENAYDTPYLPDGSPNPARKLKAQTEKDVYKRQVGARALRPE